MSQFHYDIHGLLRIRSTRRLPELGYFLTDAATFGDAPVDIEVRIAARPERFRQLDAVCYREVLGSFGFDIVINRGQTTEVIASPLIGISPHVLYTNVVEPLVRWTLVRKGYALMHGACLAFGDEALFITAQTDTGKTTTILHTLRHNAAGCTFLSDDMTIFRPDGAVFSYPKPLTISFHTLQAVGAAPLTLRERLFLHVQSRLHSKGGRRAGMWLNDIAMPAATLSAIVQRLIPPPKYMVDRLIPEAQYRDQAQLSRIVVIERGADSEGALAQDETLRLLAANSEDAYGFPPYPKIASQLIQWTGEDLSVKERGIVRQAVSQVPASYVRSSSFAWYQRLPALVGAPNPLRPAPTPSALSYAPSVGD